MQLYSLILEPVYFLLDLPVIPDIDLGFVISATGVASNENFNLIKEAVAKLIELHGKERVRYSIIVFGDTPTVRLRFSDGFGSEEVMKVFVTGITNTRQGSALDKALKKAKDQFDQDGRAHAKKILVVVTDKKSDSSAESVKMAAKSLEKSGIKVIPIAIGTEADVSELKKITTNKKNLIDARKPTDANSIAERIVLHALQGLIIFRIKCFKLVIRSISLHKIFAFNSILSSAK